MSYRWLWAAGLLATLLINGGCSRQTGIPTQIEVDRDRQAEIIAEFIRARYDGLEQAKQGFPDYVRLVEANRANKAGRASEALFHKAYPLYLDEKRSTREIVDDFLASPEGAYLSEQDREYIKRTRAERRKQAREFQKQLEADEPILDSAIAKEMDLNVWYSAGMAMRSFLREIPDVLLEECAEAIRTTMLEHDQHALWQAFAKGDSAAINEYKDSGARPTVTFLTTYAIHDVLAEAEGKGLLDHALAEYKARMKLALVLTQLFDPSLYGRGYILVEVETSGFNEYIGQQSLDRLHRRVTEAIRTVARRSATP